MGPQPCHCHQRTPCHQVWIWILRTPCRIRKEGGSDPRRPCDRILCRACRIPLHYGYGVAPVVSPFVAHPNGALVPAEPKDVVDARAEHLAAHAEKEREIERK